MEIHDDLTVKMRMKLGGVRKKRQVNGERVCVCVWSRETR